MNKSSDGLSGGGGASRGGVHALSPSDGVDVSRLDHPGVVRGRLNVDVFIPTLNESQNIEHSLGSVIGWARRVFVVDSCSKDSTREIAERMGAGVVVRPWLGYAKQKNWAIDNLPFESDWVFILDADEVMQDDLKCSVEEVVSKRLEDVSESGFYANRYFIFLGKRIRHCGYYPSWNLRLFKRGRARYEQREVHEHMIVDGPEGYLRGNMEHNDRRGLEDYMAKHNRHSTLEAREIVDYMDGVSSASLDASLTGNPLERRRWIKHVLYPKLPVRWLFRFVYMYVLRLGFLDGMTGFRFCMFMSAYELLIGLKIIEEKQRRTAGARAVRGDIGDSAGGGAAGRSGGGDVEAVSSSMGGGA